MMLAVSYAAVTLGQYKRIRNKKTAPLARLHFLKKNATGSEINSLEVKYRKLSPEEKAHESCDAVDDEVKRAINSLTSRKKNKMNLQTDPIADILERINKRLRFKNQGEVTKEADLTQVCKRLQKIDTLSQIRYALANENACFAGKDLPILTEGKYLELRLNFMNRHLNAQEFQKELRGVFNFFVNDATIFEEAYQISTGNYRRRLERDYLSVFEGGNILKNASWKEQFDALFEAQIDSDKGEKSFLMEQTTVFNQERYSQEFNVFRKYRLQQDDSADKARTLDLYEDYNSFRNQYEECCSTHKAAVKRIDMYNKLVEFHSKACTCDDSKWEIPNPLKRSSALRLGKCCSPGTHKYILLEHRQCNTTITNRGTKIHSWSYCTICVPQAVRRDIKKRIEEHPTLRID